MEFGLSSAGQMELASSYWMILIGWWNISTLERGVPLYHMIWCMQSALSSQPLPLQVALINDYYCIKTGFHCFILYVRKVWRTKILGLRNLKTQCMKTSVCIEHPSNVLFFMYVKTSTAFKILKAFPPSLKILSYWVYVAMQ